MKPRLDPICVHDGNYGIPVAQPAATSAICISELLDVPRTASSAYTASLLQAIELLRSLTADELAPMVDRRTRPRHSATFPITVQEADSQRSPQGPPLTAVCCNVSTAGMGFVHQVPLQKAAMVLIDIPNQGERLRVVGQVVRCQPVGSFYDIGVRFLERLSQPKNTASAPHDSQALASNPPASQPVS